MIVLCCVVLYDFVHCLLLRRNNKYIERNVMRSPGTLVFRRLNETGLVKRTFVAVSREQ